MILSQTVAANFLQNVLEPLLDGSDPAHVKLENIWRNICNIKGTLLSLALVQKYGNTVCNGPFKGLQLPPEALNGLCGPELLGLYETELHPIIETAIARNYRQIVNIGCAAGYYAVGLARRMPQAHVTAYDNNPEMAAVCEKTAILNGVQDRVTVHPTACNPDDLAKMPPHETLLFVDIEGGEDSLLDPTTTPALANLDILVELHECFCPGLAKKVICRFLATHTINLVANTPQPLPDLGQLFDPPYALDHFDPALITWERRNGPTPWAMMIQKRHDEM
jgi:SAM-dependent methyltransferase